MWIFHSCISTNLHKYLRSERARDIFVYINTCYRSNHFRSNVTIISNFPELLKFVKRVIACLPYCTFDIHVYNKKNNNNSNGITQTAFPQSGSSSTWGTNGFTSLSKDGVAKEDHLNVKPHGQAGNQTRDLLASSQRSYQLS